MIATMLAFLKSMLGFCLNHAGIIYLRLSHLDQSALCISPESARAWWKAKQQLRFCGV